MNHPDGVGMEGLLGDCLLAESVLAEIVAESGEAGEDRAHRPRLAVAPAQRGAIARASWARRSATVSRRGNGCWIRRPSRPRMSAEVKAHVSGPAGGRGRDRTQGQPHHAARGEGSNRLRNNSWPSGSAGCMPRPDSIRRVPRTCRTSCRPPRAGGARAADAGVRRAADPGLRQGDPRPASIWSKAQQIGRGGHPEARAARFGRFQVHDRLDTEVRVGYSRVHGSDTCHGAARQPAQAGAELSKNE